MNTQKTEPNGILGIIGRIVETTTDGNYIYRGEPEHYKLIGEVNQAINRTDAK